MGRTSVPLAECRAGFRRAGEGRLCGLLLQRPWRGEGHALRQASSRPRDRQSRTHGEGGACRAAAAEALSGATDDLGREGKALVDAEARRTRALEDPDLLALLLGDFPEPTP